VTNCMLSLHGFLKHPFPAARDDVMAEYRGLASGDSAFGVVLVGQSAGRNLALGLLQAVTAAGLPMPAAAALLSPWIDLTHSGDSHTTLAGKDPTLSVQHFLEPAARAYADGRSLPLADISPLFAAPPRAARPS
jgi:monoterpene epsilon-lactone hydrolase